MVIFSKLVPFAVSLLCLLYVQQSGLFASPTRFTGIKIKRPAGRRIVPSAKAGIRTLSTAGAKMKIFRLPAGRSSYKPVLKLTPQMQNIKFKARIRNSKGVMVSPGKVDLCILKVQFKGNIHAIEAKDQWVSFSVKVRNNGPATAFRSAVAVELAGRELPIRPALIVRMTPGAIRTVTSKLFIPRSIHPGRSNLIATVDKERINDDRNRRNNRKVISCGFIKERLPDYKISLRRKEHSRRNEFIKEAFIKYYYKVSIENTGSVPAPATKTYIRAYRLRSRKNPELKKSWSFDVPPLGVNRKVTFTTSKKQKKLLRCTKNTTHEVVAVVDQDNIVRESNEHNNCARNRVRVYIKKNAAQKAFRRVADGIKKAARKVGAAFYDGANFVYKGVKASMSKAAAAALWPEMAAYVASSSLYYEKHGRPLRAAEKAAMRSFFPDEHINRIRVSVAKNPGSRFEFWIGGAVAVTYGRAIVFNKGQFYKNGKLNEALLAHEMVHAYQYRKYGISAFCWKYLCSWIASGFSYRDICFEKEAYALSDNYDPAHPIRVEDLVGY